MSRLWSENSEHPPRPVRLCAGTPVGEDSLVCQRCFRVIHYGRHELGSVKPDAALQAIDYGLDWASGVVLVVDVLDFESGLPPEFIGLLRGRELLLAVNKIDLLPSQTPLEEVEVWVRRRLKALGLARVEVCLVSAVTGYGFPTLADLVQGMGGRVLLVGVTNVGKSSILERLLTMRIGGGKRKGIKPTVSPYPGTTVSVSQWHCPGVTFADSPGFVPRVESVIWSRRSRRCRSSLTAASVPTSTPLVSATWY